MTPARAAGARAERMESGNLGKKSGKRQRLSNGRLAGYGKITIRAGGPAADGMKTTLLYR
jgi:hypothetical protein